MKTTLLSLKAFFTICLLCLVGGVNVMADTYTYTFKKGDLEKTTPKTYTFNKVEWNVSGKIAYIGWDATNTNKGIQLASKSNNQTDVIFSTTNIPGTITAIKINSCVGSKGKAEISVKVGGTSWGTQTNTTTTSKSFDFTGAGNGEISIELKNQAGGKALYIKSIAVEYTTGNVISAPTITPTSQEFSKPFTATISPVEGATIYYTIDGSDPRTSTTRLEYTTGVEIPAATTTLKACAVKGEATSSVSSVTYTYIPPTPTIDQASKTFSKSFVATISCTDANAQIYYTLDGKDPNEKSELYTEAGVTIPEATTTLKAIAIKDGIQSEAIAEAVYTYVMPNAPITNTIWSEDWSNFKSGAKPTAGTNATYECKNGETVTRILTDNYAGGTTPELLISKGNGSLTIDVTSLNGYSGTLYFSFLTNKSFLNDEGGSNFTVTSTTTDVKIGKPIEKGDQKYTCTITVPEGTEGLNLKLTNIGSSNMRVDNLELYAVKTGSFTITPAQYGTYYTEDAFVMPEGVTGYTITEKNGESLTLNAAYPANEVVPAKTALLLKATEKPATNQEFTYTIVNSTAAAPADNLLHGSVEATETHVEGATAYYKLAEGDEGLGFYWANANGTAFTNGANKAYLAITTGSLSQMRGFSFESMTTGINNVVANTNNSKNAVIYDLNGRRVNSLNAAKGVYIVNGKKVIVK